VCSDIIATGCNDKCVRVYYLATSIDKELKKFTGSISAAIFIVRVQYLCIFLCLSFNGHFPGGPGSAGTRTFPFWILLEQKMMEMVVTSSSSSSKNEYY